MAKIGIKGLTYAPYTSGGAGSAMVYGTGVKLDDYMIRGEISEERNKVSFHADDHQIDVENSLTGVTMTLELSNFTDALDSGLLGHAAGTGNELNVTEANAPYVGVGFIRKERFKGTASYHGYWVYKVQFSKESDSAQTKGESVEFQTESVTGSSVGVQLAADGPIIYYSHLRAATEAAVRTWLNGKAGIT